MMNAQTDVIRARRRYFDRRFETHKQAGRALNDLTREELKALHRYPLVEADQFFEGYLRAEDNGAGFAMEMIYIYNRKKITDWNSGRLVIATDSDGRSYSPPGNGQYRAGLQGVSMAVEEGRTAVHGLSATQQMNQIITMLDVLLGSNR